jgi:hypothetical protein
MLLIYYLNEILGIFSHDHCLRGIFSFSLLSSHSRTSNRSDTLLDKAQSRALS